MRYDRLDALRGLALVWMAIFHLAFDLANAGLTAQNFYADPVWLYQRTAILSLFLFCAGLGQAVALHHHRLHTRFWWRWMQIAGCAVLVSLGSAWVFPSSWIYFGVLHSMLVMLLIARGTRQLTPWGRAALGVLAVILPLWVQHPFFDQPWAQWTGLVTHKPRSEDFVPILPWIGVMWWGMAVGQWLLCHAPEVLTGPLPGVMRPMAVLGRWSLSFYMIHQPVFVGVLALWQVFHPRL